MVFKTTSIKGGRRAGFTVAEFLVAMGISGIVVLVVAALSLYSGRSLAAMMNYVELDSESRLALDRMSKEIRQANRLLTHASTSITLQDADGLNLTFYWNPSTRELIRLKSGQEKVLLRGCDFLEFKIFQRNPVGGTYDQYPAATPASCKLVSVSWTCSRDLILAKANTQSVQTAKIVIRKR